MLSYTGCFKTTPFSLLVYLFAKGLNTPKIQAFIFLRILRQISSQTRKHAGSNISWPF